MYLQTNYMSLLNVYARRRKLIKFQVGVKVNDDTKNDLLNRYLYFRYIIWTLPEPLYYPPLVLSSIGALTH